MRRLVPLALVAAATASVGLAAPASASAEEDASAPIPTTDLRPLHALSVYGRGLFVPGFLLSGFLQQYTELQSGAVGASYIYRKGNLDIVTSLDLSFMTLPDGNFLGAGKDPAVDTHYTQFRDLNLLSIDVGFFWVHDINRWLAFTIGGGVGLGWVMGDVYVTNDAGAGCNSASAGDTMKCNPNVVPDNYRSVGNPVPTWTDASGKQQGLSGPLVPSDPDFQRKLDGLGRSRDECVARTGGDCRDTSLHPYYHQASEKPPVMVVINFQLGFKLKLHRHFNFNVMGGFRDGFVVGGGPEYVF